MYKAQIPNPALHQFSRLIGEWKTVGTHPYLPGKILQGRSSFKWIEGGAFLVWYSEIDEPNFPSGVAIFGSDDSTKELFILYFDERKVSRKYEISFQDNVLRWWRNAPGFLQRYAWTFIDDNTIMSKGELCRDDRAWETDLEQTFTRVK